MKIRYVFLILLSCYVQLAFGQNQTFGVKINDNLVGRFTQSTEYNGNEVTSFSSLKVKINSLNDTIAFTQHVIYQEDSLGRLQSVRSQTIMIDTTVYTALINPDSSIISRSKDTLVYRKSTIFFGPEGVRLISQKALDSVGATVCYPTFIPELKAVKEVKRTVKYSLIEKAQKVWVVEEAVDDQVLSIGKFDRAFRMISSASQTPYGRITLNTFTPLDTLEQMFPANSLTKSVRSNTFLPDPTHIKAIELDIALKDTLLHFTLADNSFELYLSDSVETMRYKTPIDWVGFSNSDSINQALVAIWLQRDAYISKMEKLLKMAQDFSDYPRFNNLKLLQFTRMIGLSSRIVEGFVYDYGTWHSHLWVEVALDGEWLPYDAHESLPINRALRIPLWRNALENSFTSWEAFPYSPSDSLSITIKEFLMANRSIKLKRENHAPVEIKGRKYIDHALGVEFEIPDSFSVAVPNLKEIFRLENQRNSRITMQQISRYDMVMDTLIWQSLVDFTQIAKEEIQQDKKTEFVYAVGSKRAAIVMRQGDSFYLIKIYADVPEDIVLFLLDKNLTIHF